MTGPNSTQQGEELVASTTIAWPTRGTPAIPSPTQSAVATGALPNFAPNPVMAPQGIPPSATTQTHTQEVKTFSLGTELTEADRNADYFSVHLPSEFTFYPFKRLSVKLITGRQQAKFARAAKEENLRYAVEAITSCLGDGVDCMDLTIPDFYFLMYWLKIASYTKFNFTHVATCYNEAHVKAHSPKTKKPDARLKNISLEKIHIINNTNLKQTNYVQKPIQGLEPVEAIGLILSPPRIRDSVEFSDQYSPEDEDFNEAEYLVEVAACISPTQNNAPKPLTLRQRIELAATLPGDVIEAIKVYQQAMQSYGVEETIQVKCGCGAEIKTKVSISAHTFL